jgi:DNA end-binding protein Ku
VPLSDLTKSAAGVVDLMEALRRSGGHAEPAKAPTKPKAAGQKEALLPIEGKKPVKETAAKKPAAKPQRKSAWASRIDPSASRSAVSRPRPN